MANFVSIIRIFIALISVFLLFIHSDIAYIAAIILAIIAFAFDGLDGYLARLLDEESKLGAVLDIMGDRIVETSFWIVLALLGYLSSVISVNALFPIICITRAFSVDSIRSVALSKGYTAFGSTTMQSSPIGRFICASRFMRILYAVVKIAAFGILMIAHIPSVEKMTISGDVEAFGIALAWFAIILCVVRGLPVLMEAKNIINDDDEDE